MKLSKIVHLIIHFMKDNFNLRDKYDIILISYKKTINLIFFNLI